MKILRLTIIPRRHRKRVISALRWLCCHKWRDAWLCRIWRQFKACAHCFWGAAKACVHRFFSIIEGWLSSLVKCLLQFKLILAFLYASFCALYLLRPVPQPPPPPTLPLDVASSVTVSIQAALPEADSQIGSRLSTFADLLTLGVAIVGIYLLNLRLAKQDRQISAQLHQNKIQIDVLRNQQQQTTLQFNKEISDKLNAAVILLGSSESSARTAAIYSLCHLAFNENSPRSKIVQILCAHIRSKTEEEAYREQHPTRPSNEIQTAIDLLFKEPREMRGLYPNFPQGLPPANLSRAYLVGADFSRAKCKDADFSNASCQGVNFKVVDCQGAIFEGADCQGANFYLADCQKADFTAAHCQGANFKNAHCKESVFKGSHCQGADFEIAECQGASFSEVRCQGANFKGAEFHGAYAIFNEKGHLRQYRIGEFTELDTMVILGEFNKEENAAIERARHILSEEWYADVQHIKKETEGMDAKYGCPAGIKPGTLEKDSISRRERDRWLYSL